MDAEIRAAVVLVILALLGGAGGLVAYLFKEIPTWIHRAMEVQLRKMEQQLEANTKISTEARDLSNGKLIELQQALADERARRVRLEAIIAEANADTHARACLDRAAQSLRQREEEDATLRRLLGQTESGGPQ
jgi:hypothetical protein